MAGDEVVQLYVRDLVASVAQPITELKGFKRVSLNPGEEKTVTFLLKPADLAFLVARLKSVLEAGELEVMIGRCSTDICLRGRFYLEIHRVFGFKNR